MGCNSAVHSLTYDTGDSSCSYDCENISYFVNCQEIVIPDSQRVIAVKGENNSRRVTFIVPRTINNIDLSSKTFVLTTLNNENVTKTINLNFTQDDIKEEYINIHWIIDTVSTSVAGDLYVEISVSDNVIVWKTFKNKFIIAESL